MVETNCEPISPTRTAFMRLPPWIDAVARSDCRTSGKGGHELTEHGEGLLWPGGHGSGKGEGNRARLKAGGKQCNRQRCWPQASRPLPLTTSNSPTTMVPS